jgi:hypothetical protein
MKPANRFFQLFINARLATLLCCSLLVSCGGSETTAGIGGTGISYGAVTGFGSIILNGSRLDDSTASVTLDGNPGAGLHGGLKQGMVVRASGNFSGNTGTAESIEFRDNLEGLVCASSTAGGITTLRVLGQTVIVDAATNVDNNATINVGDIVEVSGLTNDLEQIIATFIEVKNPIDAEVEVKGNVDTVDNVAKTLNINDLFVDFSTALIDNNIPGGAPAVGQFVEVKGTIFACGTTTDTLTATKVELEPEGAGEIPDGVRAEVEGFITELTTNGFKIGDQEIDLTGNPQFLPEDFDASFLVVGAKVEAEGTSANGVITATKISFRENVKLESDVATVNGNSFTLEGLPSIPIAINSVTTPLGVTVSVGDTIRVRGIEGPNNTVLATRIDDRSGQTDAILQGAVDEINMGTEITVLGIPVDTLLILDNFPNPPLAFADVNDQAISRATFLDLVQPGTLVKFKSNLAESTIIWDEAELEDD